ncbi:MAG: glycosyltransferase family 2 protein, partial [Lachnospiraceae bacterium]|nr:glycosyltransferase family 2 protein [Lachnospiraceae bacterium]
MPKEQETISIVVPVYKVETLLDRCVASVTAQTYPDWELILVEDGSPDRCGEICDAWAARDPRIRVIHQPNGGLSAARNAGIREAKGKWLAFLDSDDWWAETFLEEMLGSLRETEADLAICGWRAVFEDGRPSEERLPEKGLLSSREALGILSGREGVLFVTAWNRLIRRSLWEELCFPEGKLHEDEFTAHLLLERMRRIAVLDRPLVHYWQRKGSITAVSGDLRHWDGAEAFALRYRFFSEKGYGELLEPTFEKFVYQYFLCLRELDSRSPKGKEQIRRIRKEAAPLRRDRANMRRLPRGERLGMQAPLLWARLYRLRHGKESINA